VGGGVNLILNPIPERLLSRSIYLFIYLYLSLPPSLSLSLFVGGERVFRLRRTGERGGRDEEGEGGQRGPGSLNRSEVDSVRRKAVALFASSKSTRIIFCLEMSCQVRYLARPRAIHRFVPASYIERTPLHSPCHVEMCHCYKMQLRCDTRCRKQTKRLIANKAAHGSGGQCLKVIDYVELDPHIKPKRPQACQ
jgi:hypothetical protein